jgi:ribosomal protein S6--L-glutamate ligase
MNIFFMVAPTRAHLAELGPIPDDVYVHLRRRGHVVHAGFAEDSSASFDHIRNEYDVYVMKAHDELWLSVAAILHAQGAFILEPYESCIALQNKIYATHRLGLIGVPVPKSWIATNRDHLKELLRRHPILLKPHVGGMGRSKFIRFIRTEEDLIEDIPSSFIYYVQQYISGTGLDLKVYVVGSNVFALRKYFAPQGYTTAVERCAVADDVRVIVDRCSRAFGICLFGLDIIESESGPVVVDINYFPSYFGIPEAGELIAEYIESRIVKGK